MATASFKPGTFDIDDLTQGDTLYQPIQVITGGTLVGGVVVGGTPYNFTGHTARARIEKKDGTLVVLLTSDPGGGITLAGEWLTIDTETALWPAPCDLYWDCEINDASNRKRTWFAGKIKMRKGITPTS